MECLLTWSFPCGSRWRLNYEIMWAWCLAKYCSILFDWPFCLINAAISWDFDAAVFDLAALKNADMLVALFARDSHTHCTATDFFFKSSRVVCARHVHLHFCNVGKNDVDFLCCLNDCVWPHTYFAFRAKFRVVVSYFVDLWDVVWGSGADFAKYRETACSKADWWQCPVPVASVQTLQRCISWYCSRIDPLN